MKYCLTIILFTLSHIAWSLPGMPTITTLENGEYDKLYTRAFQSDCIKKVNANHSLSNLFSSGEKLDCSNNKDDVQFCSCLDDVSATDFSKEEVALIEKVQKEIEKKLEVLEEERLIEKYEEKVKVCVKLYTTYGFGSCANFDLPHNASERSKARYKALSNKLFDEKDSPVNRYSDKASNQDAIFFESLIANLKKHGASTKADENKEILEKIQKEMSSPEYKKRFKESPIYNIFQSGQNSSNMILNEILRLGENKDSLSENLDLVSDKLRVLYLNHKYSPHMQVKKVTGHTIGLMSKVDNHAISSLFNQSKTNLKRSVYDETIIKNISENSEFGAYLQGQETDINVTRDLILSDTYNVIGSKFTINLSNEINNFIKSNVKGELFRELFNKDATPENIKLIAQVRDEVFNTLTDEEKKILDIKSDNAKAIFDYRFDQLYCDNRKKDHLFATSASIARKMIPLEEREKLAKTLQEANEDNDEMVEESRKLENLNHRIEDLIRQKADLEIKRGHMLQTLTWDKKILDEAIEKGFPEADIARAKSAFNKSRLTYAQINGEINKIEAEIKEKKKSKQAQNKVVQQLVTKVSTKRKILNSFTDKYANSLNRNSFRPVTRNLNRSQAIATQAITKSEDIDSGKVQEKTIESFSKPKAYRQDKMRATSQQTSQAVVQQTSEMTPVQQQFKPTRTDLNYMRKVNSILPQDKELDDLEKQLAALETEISQERQAVEKEKEQDEINSYLNKIDDINAQIKDAKAENSLAKSELQRIQSATNSSIGSPTPSQVNRAPATRAVSASSTRSSAPVNNTIAPTQALVAPSNNSTATPVNTSSAAQASQTRSSSASASSSTSSSRSAARSSSSPERSFGLTELEQVTLGANQTAVKLEENFSELSPVEQKEQLLKLFEQSNASEIFVELDNGVVVKVEKDSLDQLEKVALEKIEKKELEKLALEELGSNIEEKESKINRLTTRVQSLNNLLSQGTK